MSDGKHIPLKAFWATVEARLAACSADELRAILRAMANETPPTGRQAFLARLERHNDMGDPLEQALQRDELLSEIEELAEDLEASLAEAEPWEERYERYDRHRWDEGYNDDEGMEAIYEEYVEPLVELFDRAQAAFDYGRPSLAREAYEKLFELLDIRDDYGRGLHITDLTGVHPGETYARYLRAVYETEPPARRPTALFEAMHQVEVGLATRNPMLDDLLQISSCALPNREPFLVEWIAYLRTQNDSAADALLREAIRLSQGTPGLAALAREEGRDRPRAYLDWFAALEKEGRYSKALAAAQQALQDLPAELPIRATIADHLCAAAARLDEPEALRSGRWEAFLAEPTLSRLLDVWDALPGNKERTTRMRQAACYLRDRLAQPPQGFRGFSWEFDGLERPVRVRTTVLAHAYLLAGQLEDARQLAAREKVLGWSSDDNPQGLVVTSLLVLLSGGVPGDLPPNLAQLWWGNLQGSAWYSSGQEELQARLERVYAERFARMALAGASEVRALTWCLDVAERRIDAIVGGQHRGSYDKAAMLTVACAMVLHLRGDPQRAGAWIDGIRDRYPRHRSFQAELRTALARKEQ